jgi:hypothetical protein
MIEKLSVIIPCVHANAVAAITGVVDLVWLVWL